MMDPLGELNAGRPAGQPTPVNRASGLGESDPEGPSTGSPYPENIIPYGQTPAGPAGSTTMPHTASMVQARRDVFWQNVTREVLMAMAAAAAADTGRITPTPSGAANSPNPISDMFDGRMGLITTLGQRIPIADVIPVFAVSRPGCPEDRMRSADVQCSVFRITTPTGESYTLPIHHIAGIHSMSAALANQLEAAAREMEDDDGDGGRQPFGFGAYTSLARSESQPPPQQPSPNQPASSTPAATPSE